MNEPFIGEIRIFPYSFVPLGWLECDGRVLPVNSENEALYSLIGTVYGGNGSTTFALPDLRGRMLMATGQGPGLSARQPGEQVGQATVALATHQLPPHRHPLPASTAVATSVSPVGAVPATLGSGAAYAAGGASLATAHVVSATGGGQAHENRQPYLVLRHAICVDGVFPGRS